MKTKFLIAVSCLLLAPAIWAQQPRPATTLPAPPAAGSVLQTPAHAPTSHDANIPNSTEAWLYAQEMQRYEDPDKSVRRKAEATAAQRMSRIAALKWYGQSNARPHASPVPTMDAYSPSWVGNSWQPYHWAGVAQSPRSMYVLPHYLR